MIKDLPSFYWDFIMEYLPDYYRRDDVLESDIYTRYLEGEEVSEEDIQYFFANKTRLEIESEYISNEWELFLDAFEAFASARYKRDDKSKHNKLKLEQLGNKAFVPYGDGTYYIIDNHAYGIDDFLKEYFGIELFLYKVTGTMDDEKMHHFNNLFKESRRKGEICYDVATADRMNYLHKIGCDLQFVDTAKPLARANLIKCGGLEMPAIIGGMLKEFYFNNLSGRTTMEDRIEYLAENDIAGYGFDDLEATYRGKIAHLLLCTFTGMRLGTKWNGRQEVNGGYIVVKNNGDVVAFHSTIADEFKDFLVAKIVMESPSHSRHRDMVIFKDGDKYYLKLALQLRFILNR